METTLVYDGKCSLCRNLAYKIQVAARGPVQIRALTDPEATQLLARAFPDGWSHDFYLFYNGRCKKGVSALRGLRSVLGSKQLALLLAEYTRIRLSQELGRTDDRSQAGSSAGSSIARRNVLKAAAITPVMYPISKLPRMADPFEERPNGILVNVSEVTRRGSRYSATARRCEECIREPLPVRGVTESAKPPRVLENEHVRKGSVVLQEPGEGQGQAAESGSLEIERTRIELQGGGENSDGQHTMTVYHALLDARRYNIGFGVAQEGQTGVSGDSGPVSLAGMVGHDQPMPVVDLISYDGAGTDVGSHLDAYRSGVRELAKLHKAEGRVALTRLYEQIDAGFLALARSFEGAVSEALMPASNSFAVTSMPELFRFVDIPVGGSEVGTASHLCNCSLGCCCGCGTCIGCGFTVGFCSSPLCGACTGCGCGCGYCCGCSACA